MIIREIILNNKSRKGRYIYISNGLKHRYYRKYADKTERYYLNMFRNPRTTKIVRQRPKALPTEHKLKPGLSVTKEKTLLSLLKKRPATKSEIEKILKSGMTVKEIQNILSLSDTQIRENISQMLQKHTKKRYADILSQETNMQRLKQRLEIKVIVQDKDNNTLGTLVTAGKKTIREALKDIMSAITIGMQYQEFSEATRDLGNKGWSYMPESKGEVAQVKMLVTFRKK